MPSRQDVHCALLFDDSGREHLFPLAQTRPLAHFRLGVDTLQEKWARALNLPVLPHVPDGLCGHFRQAANPGDWFVQSRLLPDQGVVKALLALEPGEALIRGDDLLGARCRESCEPEFEPQSTLFSSVKAYAGTASLIRRLFDLTELNGDCLNSDFAALTVGRESQELHASNTVFGDGGVFLEPGASVLGSVLDTREGPVYLGKNSEIMPGCLVRGPFALGEQGLLKMGAKIYGGTTIGPGCKVGGEVSRSILFANSNKSHDGFLGHSVLGEWCNLGADTNNSNLKNDYGPVKLWNHASQALEDTGLQFCGLFMGDHSKAGINSMFNTGTVAGVCSNLFGAGFQAKFIPSFAWGGPQGYETHKPEKALETARLVMSRRGLEITAQQRELLLDLFSRTAPQRVWENQSNAKLNR